MEPKKNYVDLAEDMNKYRVEFFLYPINWSKFKSTKGFNIRKGTWKETKYLNDEGTDIHLNVKRINNKTGGLYLFIVKSNILPQISEYLVYIGRAQYTQKHNLRIRVKKYFREYIGDNDRPKITRMMTYWNHQLFLKYIEVSNNKLIKTLEARLINTLLPPFNDQIPDKKIRKAIKAFR